jgi:hypothetical protein
VAGQADVMVAPTLKRPEIEYQIPDRIRAYPDDPKSVTVRPITLKEEIDANNVATTNGSGAAGLVIEIVRRSVCRLNGKLVDWSTPDPQWIESTSPKVRDLITEAVLKWNRVSKAESDDFFATEKLGAGG